MSTPRAPERPRPGEYRGEVTVYIRRNVWELTSESQPWDPITEAYARAVAVMQTRPVRDPTSWLFQANMHWTYDDASQQPLWNQCPHSNWFFTPWHRLYLYHFERIVRAIVQQQHGPNDFALPYWNYDQDGWNKLPPPFRQRTMSDGRTPNPLYLEPPLRDPNLVAGALIPPQLTNSTNCLRPTNFTGGTVNFGGTSPDAGGGSGALERTPHNTMHTTIGGRVQGANCGQAMMSQVPCAARDPIFWLHHANIDRLWNTWVGLGEGRQNPSDRAWLDRSYTFIDDEGQQSTMIPRDALDTRTQLGYIYDTESEERAGTEEARAMAMTSGGDGGDGHGGPGEEPPQLVAGSDRPVILAGRAVEVALTTPEETRDLLRDAARRDGRPMYLIVDNLEADYNPGVVYGVYFDMPPRGDRQRYHVGNLTAFGIEAANDPEATHGAIGGLHHSYDVRDLVLQLVDTSEWDPDAISVTFEPIGLMPVGGGEPAREAEGVSELRVGSVGLYVG
jgi:hypothetical protein